MKKIIVTLVAVFAIAQFSYAQTTWTPSGTNIYNPNAGNVGIGTSTPGSKLEVAGGLTVNGGNFQIINSFPTLVIKDSSAGTDNKFLDIYSAYGTTSFRLVNDAYSAANNWMTVTRSGYMPTSVSFPNGNVGIGTTTPTTPLQFGNAGSFPVAIVGLYDGGATTKYGLGINLSGGIDGTGGLVAYSGDRGFVIRHDNITGTENFSVDYAGDTYIRGNVGIGTTTPDAKLTVNGTIHSTEVKVDVSVPGPDYVFKPDYKLIGLSDLKTYVDKNHHLPEIPSAKEMAKDGLNLGDMNTKLLKKVEELTLYVIDQQQQIQKLKKQQQKEINQLKNQVAKLVK